MGEQGKLDQPEVGIQEREYKGRLISPDRDIWVIRLSSRDGNVSHATSSTEGSLHIEKRQLQKMQEDLGAQHPDTLRFKNNLGRLLKRKGSYEEAERLHQEVLQASRATLGGQHPD